MPQTISEWKCFIEPFQAVEDLAARCLLLCTGSEIFADDSWLPAPPPPAQTAAPVASPGECSARFALPDIVAAAPLPTASVHGTDAAATSRSSDRKSTRLNSSHLGISYA